MRLNTTPAMRARCRELTRQGGTDDYDRVVQMLLDDVHLLLSAIVQKPLVSHAAQVPTPPPGKHYELVPDGQTLSEITDAWGNTTKQMLLNKCDAVAATKRAEAAEAALAECRAEVIEECASEVEKLGALEGSRWDNPTNAAAIIRALATKEAPRHE